MRTVLLTNNSFVSGHQWCGNHHYIEHKLMLTCVAVESLVLTNETVQHYRNETGLQCIYYEGIGKVQMPLAIGIMA